MHAMRERLSQVAVLMAEPARGMPLVPTRVPARIAIASRAGLCRRRANELRWMLRRTIRSHRGYGVVGVYRIHSYQNLVVKRLIDSAGEICALLLGHRSIEPVSAPMAVGKSSSCRSPSS